MSYNKLLKKIEAYIDSFYIEHADSRLLYHNYAHAKEVVDAAEKISKHTDSDERSTFIVCAAAWFLDTGYFVQNFGSYKVKSAELAETYLRSIGTTEADIADIKKCILATSNLQSPASLPEQIVCDAATFYFGTSKFKEKQKLLKKEVEAVKNTKISGDEWRSKNISLLEKHQYYTDYCRTLLNKTKMEQLHKLKNKQMEKLWQSGSSSFAKNDSSQKQVDPDASTQTKKSGAHEKKPIRGVETMFRISSSNSQKISSMADNKAHIMISVNSIIISVVLGLIVGKMGDHDHRQLIIPTIILMAVNVATIIYSVLATRPKVHRGIFTPEQLEKKSVNLLFYGSFYNMDFEEYDSGMRQMMNDREFLYGSLIKDIYWQGKVLGRKYKLLHTSYNIFMYGIAVSVIAYTIAAFLSR